MCSMLHLAHPVQLWIRCQDKVVWVGRRISTLVEFTCASCVVSAVQNHGEEVLHCLWCSQDERRRIGTPTARARVGSHLWHILLFRCCVWQHIFENVFALVALIFSNVQVTMEFGLDKRAQTLQGLAFPLQEEAKGALRQLKQRRINYIQLVSRKKNDGMREPQVWNSEFAVEIVWCAPCCRGWTWRRRPSSSFTPNLQRLRSFSSGFPLIPRDTTSSSSNTPTRVSRRRHWVSGHWCQGLREKTPVSDNNNTDIGILISVWLFSHYLFNLHSELESAPLSELRKG